MSLCRRILLALSLVLSIVSHACYYDFSMMPEHCASTYGVSWAVRTCGGMEYVGCDALEVPGNTCELSESDCCFLPYMGPKEYHKVCPSWTPPATASTGPSTGGSCQDKEEGSIIRIDSQSVSEAIPLVGIPYTLNYSSERTKGRTVWYKVKIPITHSNMYVADSIVSEDLEVSIAGQTFSMSFSPAAGITYDFTWDGKDNLANPVWGSKEATIVVTEKYNFTPSEYIPKVSKVFLGSVFNSGYGINGWDVSVHHTYDPVRGILYLGNGDEYRTQADNRLSGEHWIVSQNRSEIYIFDSSYRHVQTRNALVGSTKLSFSYDNSNKLTSIEDAYGNETTLQYNGSNLISVTSPYGQITTITTDVNGYISSITNPASEKYEMTYNSLGLLLTFEKPSGVTSTMTYDGDGLLLTDFSSEGSSSTLARSVLDNVSTITHTSALGRTKTLVVDATNTSLIKTVTDAMGVQKIRNEDYTTNGITTSGSAFSYSATYQNDPWFGDMFKVLETESIYENGNTKTTSYSESPILTTPGDPFSIVSLNQTTSSNGKVSTKSYTASNKTLVITSPVGRTTTLIFNNKGDEISKQISSFTPLITTYDSYGKIEEISQGLNRVTTMTYHSSNGLLASVTNPLGQINSYNYDSAGRLSAHTLPDSRVISYTYDADGNISSITPPSRPLHSFVLNGYDMLATYSPPLLAGVPVVATTYLYNDDRQLIQVNRPDGQVILRNFNPYYSHLDSEELPNGTRTYTYNYSYGRLSQSVSEDSFTRGFSFSDNLLFQDNMYGGALNYAINYTYNPDFSNRLRGDNRWLNHASRHSIYL